MPITINGNGTITGLSVGGLPDGTVDTDTLATGTGGKILQVKQTTDDAPSQILSSASAQTWYTITTINVAITPSSASNKILVSAHVTGEGNKEDHEIFYRLARTVGGTTTGFAIADSSASNRVRSTGVMAEMYYAGNNSSTLGVTDIADFLDSPNTTSEITYHVQIACNTGTFSWLINRCWSTDDQYNYERGCSWLTVKEVAA